MDEQYIKCNCKYKEAFNNNHTPMIILDSITGKIDDANLAACNYYLCSKEKLLSMYISDINILPKKEIFKEIDRAKSEDRQLFRFKHKLSNGEIRDVEVYSGPMRINNKDLLFSVIHDVKEKSELENNYLISKAYFDSLFNNSPEAIAIVSSEFKVLNINTSFEKIFQYSLKDVKDKDITTILCDENLYGTSYRFRESIKKGKFVKEEVTRNRKDGTSLEVLLLAFPLVVEGETIGIYCIYSDISEVKKKDERIKMLTYNDILTGLFNRDFFLHNLDYEIHIRNSKKDSVDKFAVLIIKANELNEIRDALGHLVGDKMIKEFALRLRGSVPIEDVVARVGDDEFAILLRNIKDPEDLMKLVNTILKTLNKYFFIDNNEFQITTSIGIAIYPDDSIESIGLIRKAEIAMNKSKEFNISNPIRFNNAIDKEVQEYFWIKNDLAKSILNEELILNYQPIFDTSTNTLVGVEALVRWNHKINGIILPSKFIPVAEKSGMIHFIGEWVLRNACKQNQKWQEEGYKSIYISVNISILQLEQSNFCDIVKGILQESNLDPQYLQLEITETSFAQNYELIENTIKGLSKLGIMLAVDDFGTGYSSLGQLCELNINSLKIDRTFIDGVDENVNKSKIVKAVIALAKSLNINLTAEGVETEKELNFLKENRCNVAQGYLFSKPVEKDKIEKLLVKLER